MAILTGTVDLMVPQLHLSLKWNTRLTITNLQMKTTFLCEYPVYAIKRTIFHMWTPLACDSRIQDCGVGFFCLTPKVQLNHVLHHTPKLGISVEMVQFLLELSFEQRILAVHHDFHWLLVATKLLTAKLHSRYAMASEILRSAEPKVLERSESNILTPTAQSVRILCYKRIVL